MYSTVEVTLESCLLQDEITEMKRKLKIMNHQIDQLKEEIQAKEALLVKEHLEHQRVEKEKETLKAELQKMKQLAGESRYLNLCSFQMK